MKRVDPWPLKLPWGHRVGSKAGASQPIVPFPSLDTPQTKIASQRDHENLVPGVKEARKIEPLSTCHAPELCFPAIDRIGDKLGEAPLNTVISLFLQSSWTNEFSLYWMGPLTIEQVLHHRSGDHQKKSPRVEGRVQQAQLSAKGSTRISWQTRMTPEGVGWSWLLITKWADLRMGETSSCQAIGYPTAIMHHHQPEEEATFSGCPGFANVLPRTKTNSTLK